MKIQPLLYVYEELSVLCLHNLQYILYLYFHHGIWGGGGGIGNVPCCILPYSIICYIARTIYTHGHVIRAILWYLLLGRINRDEDSFKRFYHLRQALNIPNGAIVKLDLNNEEPEMSAILTDHLSC